MAKLANLKKIKDHKIKIKDKLGKINKSQNIS